MSKSLEDVRKRFQQEAKLVEFLPMLDEYIFSLQRLEWLATADVDKVQQYCIETDE